MICKNGDAIKEADAIGWTPLHYAALKGNLEATELLLLGKHDGSASYMLDKSGMSALHVAAFAGHEEVMEKLIRRHPDICDLVNHKGQTALHIAVLAGQETVVKYILKEPNLAGIIHEKDQDGNTALHLAAINQDYKIMKLLVADGRLDNTAINRLKRTLKDSHCLAMIQDVMTMILGSQLPNYHDIIADSSSLICCYLHTIYGPLL
ncbi:hypothetical protein Pyn_35571 [Prunus yedoensis var. nudiflora]|uniref:Uncharacterized protein n=1 Tax=Prunus yedoensis var. nudiflora TaxID=2094558 RepID=A0A314Y4A4_PRUYE|nr:hypothetical protein Pyn_35571 [Prunus yedoensis var. nudiflora]